MSKIEKALEKFQKESKKDTGQASLPDRSATSSTKSFRRETLGRGKNSHVGIPAKDEVENPPQQSTSNNEVTPPTQETISDKHVAEDAIPSTRIDTYDVDEHIVSYYDSIKEQPWKGPVMVHFRRLQVSLANMQKNNMCKVMLFASSTQKEGKSTISVNTAITLCSDKKSKIVMVDCDFRKPTVHKLLGINPEKGLADYLAEKAEIKDIAIKGLVPGLTIIPVGNKPPNTCEMFASDRMKQFVSYLRERFDYVIIDTSPVLAFPDTSILAPMSDGVVLVINCKKIKKSIVKRAVETLHDCKIMGFIMNRSESAAVDYYGYTSGYNSYDYASS